MTISSQPMIGVLWCRPFAFVARLALFLGTNFTHALLMEAGVLAAGSRMHPLSAAGDRAGDGRIAVSAHPKDGFHE